MRDIRPATFRFCAILWPYDSTQLSKVCFIIFNIIFHEKLENTGAGRVGRQGEKGEKEEEVKGSQIWVGTLEKQAWVPDETYRGYQIAACTLPGHISVFIPDSAALGGGPMSRPSDAHVAFPEPLGTCGGNPRMAHPQSPLSLVLEFIAPAQLCHDGLPSCLEEATGTHIFLRSHLAAVSQRRKDQALCIWDYICGYFPSCSESGIEMGTGRGKTWPKPGWLDGSADRIPYLKEKKKKKRERAKGLNKRTKE